jgi:hypothetical protein
MKPIIKRVRSDYNLAFRCYNFWIIIVLTLVERFTIQNSSKKEVPCSLSEEVLLLLFTKAILFCQTITLVKLNNIAIWNITIVVPVELHQLRILYAVQLSENHIKARLLKRLGFVKIYLFTFGALMKWYGLLCHDTVLIFYLLDFKTPYLLNPWYFLWVIVNVNQAKRDVESKGVIWSVGALDSFCFLKHIVVKKVRNLT